MEDLFVSLTSKADSIEFQQKPSLTNTPQIRELIKESSQQNKDHYHQLSNQLTTISTQLNKLKEHNNTNYLAVQQLQNSISLEQLHQSNSFNITKHPNSSKQQQASIKNTINDKTTTIQTQLQHFFQNKAIYLKQTNNNINNLIQQIKQQKNCIFQQFKTHNKYHILQNQLKILKKQITTYQKQNNSFKQNMLTLINNLKTKFNSDINKQQLKRSLYNKKIQQLLTKCCTQTQQQLLSKLQMYHS